MFFVCGPMGPHYSSIYSVVLYCISYLCLLVSLSSSLEYNLSEDMTFSRLQL